MNRQEIIDELREEIAELRWEIHAGYHGSYDDPGYQPACDALYELDLDLYELENEEN